MAETIEQTNPGIERYNRYTNAVLQQLQQNYGPEQSDSQIKNYLTKLIKPTYDNAIKQRQQQTGQANAAIDTDAASRGMGTSTWVTDAKNRQKTNEASDIAQLNSNYSSALYEALIGQINQRNQNRLNMQSMAQNVAGNMYDRWKGEEPSTGGTGGGGAGGSGGIGGRRGSGGNGNDDDDDMTGYEMPTTETAGANNALQEAMLQKMYERMNPTTDNGKALIQSKTTAGKATYTPTAQNADFLNKKTKYKI